MRNLLIHYMFFVNDNQATGLGEVIFKKARAILNGKQGQAVVKIGSKKFKRALKTIARRPRQHI